jgi:HEAT repeat protein
MNMNGEEKLLRDLKQVGINVCSVWDLVNGPNNYDKALPILIRYLESSDGVRFKEGIARALGVPRFNDATYPLIREYKKASDEGYKWAIGNSLATIAPKEALPELIEIMADQKHGSARQMIAEALGRIGDRSSIGVLIEVLKDNKVAGHAVEALGKIGDESAIEPIKPFLDHDMRWIRKAAEKALERIEKKSARRRKKG